MLFLLLAVLFLSLSNARRAAAKGLNPGLWSGITLFSFIAGLFVGCVLLCFIVLARYPDLLELAKINDRQRLQARIETLYAQSGFIYAALIFGGGFGGYLLVRYFLDKKGTK